MTDDSKGNGAPADTVDAATAQLKNRKAVQAEIDAIYQRDRLGMHVLEEYAARRFYCGKPLDIQSEINEYTHEHIEANLPNYPNKHCRLHSSTIIPRDTKTLPYQFHNSYSVTPGIMYLLDLRESENNKAPRIVFASTSVQATGDDPFDKKLTGTSDDSILEALIFDDDNEDEPGMPSVNINKAIKNSSKILDRLAEAVRYERNAFYESKKQKNIKVTNEIMFPMHTDHVRAIAFPLISREVKGINLSQEALSTLAACACYFKHRELDPHSDLPIVSYDLDQQTDKMLTVLACGPKEVKNLAERAAQQLQLLAHGIRAGTGIFSEIPTLNTGGNVKTDESTVNSFIQDYEHYCDYITSQTNLSFPKLVADDIIAVSQQELLNADITKDPLPSRLLTDPDRVRGVAQDGPTKTVG